MTSHLRLTEIRDLAYRFVPIVAADPRLYRYGYKTWWPAHELGHFLVATADECRKALFGIDDCIKGLCSEAELQYVIAKEIAATSISQRLLRRSGHKDLADEEIEYTDEDSLDSAHEPWCKRAVKTLLRTNGALRLPTTAAGLKILLKRKARAAKTAIYSSRQVAAHADRCIDAST